MYLKDKSIRITLRLNERQFEFVKHSADILEVSPSEFLRLVVNQTMNMNSKGDFRRENEDADFNYFI